MAGECKHPASKWSQSKSETSEAWVTVQTCSCGTEMVRQERIKPSK